MKSAILTFIAILIGFFPCILSADSVSLVAPNGAEKLISGSSFEILWDTNGTIENVLIEYSIDTGEVWNDVNTTANIGSYTWAVPQHNSQHCLVRVSDAENPDVNDASDAVFTIFICNLSSKADLDGDCKVDFKDFAIWSADWMRNGNPFSADVTEAPDGMVYIPGGTFQMGDSLGDGESDELPVHTVTLDSFYIGRYEVTNQPYCDFLNSALGEGLITVTNNIVYKSGSGNSYPYCDVFPPNSYSQISYNSTSGEFSVRTKSGRSMANDPMVMVSWYGAVAYCNWRSQQEGYQQCYNLSTWSCDFNKKGYRLATEAEWEYAARGGLSGRRFPWGDTITHSQANYHSSSSYSYDISPTRGWHPTWNDGIYPYTAPVGSFQANGCGVYDMSGNVWEWCNDWYSSSYYSSSPVNNPTGPTSGSSRVLRGGGWFLFAYSCRVSYRFNLNPGDRSGDCGFRVVLDF